MLKRTLVGVESETPLVIGGIEGRNLDNLARCLVDNVPPEQRQTDLHYVLEAALLLLGGANETRTSDWINELPTKSNPAEESRDRMLQFFGYKHLPEHLQEHSRPFADLAELLVATLPANPERTVALRKLLEAKDCAVRARLFK